MLSSDVGDYFLLPSQPKAFLHGCAGSAEDPWSGTRPLSHWKKFESLVTAFMLVTLLVWFGLLSVVQFQKWHFFLASKPKEVISKTKKSTRKCP